MQGGRKQDMDVPGQRGRGGQLGPSGFNKQENVSRGGFASALDSGAGLDVKTFTLVVIGICENIYQEITWAEHSGGWAVLMSGDAALHQAAQAVYTATRGCLGGLTCLANSTN